MHFQHLQFSHIRNMTKIKVYSKPSRHQMRIKKLFPHKPEKTIRPTLIGRFQYKQQTNQTKENQNQRKTKYKKPIKVKDFMPPCPVSVKLLLPLLPSFPFFQANRLQIPTISGAFFLSISGEDIAPVSPFLNKNPKTKIKISIIELESIPLSPETPRVHSPPSLKLAIPIFRI